MAGEWRQLSLREAGVTLIDCDHRTPPAVEFGYPYVTIPQLRDGRIDVSTARRITPGHYAEWTRRAKPMPGDVVLSRRTNPGVTAYVPDDLEFALGQNLVLLRASGELVIPPFLRWLVRGPDWWGQIGRFLNVGAVFDSLKCADIPSFQLPIPPLREQRAIAHALGTLDDKIELNRRMNGTLEAIARTLFKSWFVDFDPVRDKAEGRDTGLPKQLASLFPDCFDDSELGEIPKGWRIVRLGELIELAYGKALKEEDRRLGPVAVYGSRGQIGWHDEALSPGPGVIVGRKGNPGTVTWAANDYFAIDTAFYVVPSSECRSLHFLYHALGAHNLPSLGADSAVPGLNRNVAYMSRQVVPPASLLAAFDQIERPLFERMQQNESQTATLAALRDTLLPKLISGELRLDGDPAQVDPRATAQDQRHGEQA